MSDLEITEGRKPGRKWMGLILPLCIISGTIFLTGLGTWQVKRLAWKEGLIARVERNLENPAVSIEDIKALMMAGKDIEYLPVTTIGRFRHDLEQFYFATHKSNPGWFVYTPLERADGSVLFVNRGFVPINAKDPETRTKGQTEGIVKITGLARSAPTAKPNSFVPDNDLKKNVYYWKSIVQMMGQTGYNPQRQLVPFFVDAENTPVQGGYPVGGVTKITFVNSHLQYAITWYGLAGALLVVGAVFMFKRRSEDT